MALKLAINGTGRIGLCAARIIGTRDDVALLNWIRSCIYCVMILCIEAMM